MSAELQTPPISRSSSQSSTKTGRRTPNLSLDLSDLPPLIQPSPPSNTLIITNLQDPAIFAPTTLAHLRALIESHIPEPALHTFSPLRSLRRIVLTFHTVSSAASVRALLDGESLFSTRVRVYFGEATPITPRADRHLAAPKADKQFFISPPPSPPAGWESRLEEEPNKEAHAEDLASALERLTARGRALGDLEGEREEVQGAGSPGREAVATTMTGASGRRTRSSTIVVYCPEDHGNSPLLPNIEVEDTTGEMDEMEEEREIEEEIQGGWDTRKARFHTSRPPVELMGDA